MMIKPQSDVKMANYLVENRPKMNVDETRLFLTLVASINKDDIELNVLQIPVSEFAELWEIPIDAAYSRLKTALRGLRSKEFFIEGINPTTGKMRFLTTSYITTAVYEQGCACATARISDEFKPYLLALKSCYTSYVLKNVMHLDTVNAIRNYELLKQFQGLGQRTFSVSEYKQLLNLENKYGQNTDLRIKVLDPAVKEINKNTDLKVSYDFIGRGQRAKIRFTINVKPTADPNQYTLEELQENADQDARDNICLGFGAKEFESFTDDQLALLKNLGWANMREEDVERHSQNMDLAEARQWATSDYLRRAIITAQTMCPKNLFLYVKKMIENDSKKGESS